MYMSCDCHVMIAGEDDNVVRLAYGKKSADFLKTISCPKHEFKTYPNVGHSASEPVSKWDERAGLYM